MSPSSFIFSCTVIVFVLLSSAGVSLANCDEGEIRIKFSHVTNANKHPKGIAASLLEARVNEEMNGIVSM